MGNPAEENDPPPESASIFAEMGGDVNLKTAPQHLKTAQFYEATRSTAGSHTSNPRPILLMGCA